MGQGNGQSSTRRANLALALVRGLADVYDRLGLVIVGSLVWTAGTLVPISLGIELSRRVSGVFFALGLALTVFIGIPLTAGLFALANRIVTRTDPTLSDVRTGFGGLLIPSLKLGLFDFVVSGILIVDIAFFLGLVGPLRETRSVVFVVLGVVLLYLLLVWLMAVMYQFPLLVWQRSATLAVVKRSFLLALDNPLFTMGVLFVMMLLTILCVVTVIGMAALFMGTASVVITSCLRELFAKYGIVEEPPEVAEDRGWPAS